VGMGCPKENLWIMMGPSFMIKNSQRHSSGMIRQNAARNKGQNRLKNATKPAFARRWAAYTPDAGVPENLAR